MSKKQMNKTKFDSLSNDEISVLKNADKEQLDKFRKDLKNFLNTLLSAARDDKKVDEVRKLNRVILNIDKSA